MVPRLKMKTRLRVKFQKQTNLNNSKISENGILFCFKLQKLAL
jgi:phosphotransferase system IIB component